jgi:hypothetical protein
VLSGFISKSLFKINLADGTLFENPSTHLFRMKPVVCPLAFDHELRPNGGRPDVSVGLNSFRTPNNTPGASELARHVKPVACPFAGRPELSALANLPEGPTTP